MSASNGHYQTFMRYSSSHKAWLAITANLNSRTKYRWGHDECLSNRFLHHFDGFVLIAGVVVKMMMSASNAITAILSFYADGSFRLQPG
jgi:hypothetical protein